VADSSLEDQYAAEARRMQRAHEPDDVI